MDISQNQYTKLVDQYKKRSRAEHAGTPQQAGDENEIQCKRERSYRS